MTADNITPFPLPPDTSPPEDKDGITMESQQTVQCQLAYGECQLQDVMRQFCQTAYGDVARQQGKELVHFDWFLNPVTNNVLFRVYVKDMPPSTNAVDLDLTPAVEILAAAPGSN